MNLIKEYQARKRDVKQSIGFIKDFFKLADCQSEQGLENLLDKHEYSKNDVTSASPGAKLYNFFHAQELDFLDALREVIRVNYNFGSNYTDRDLTKIGGIWVVGYKEKHKLEREDW